ncbi:hypothetical protein [Xenorhabdus bovienii]|uniref:hypothetical protein n=1 Tax=Xenorhabdus bovienii TaxID=40576 RepID=UPI000170A3CD
MVVSFFTRLRLSLYWSVQPALTGGYRAEIFVTGLAAITVCLVLFRLVQGDLAAVHRNPPAIHRNVGAAKRDKNTVRRHLNGAIADR